jgi:hypothetical protein
MAIDPEWGISPSEIGVQYQPDGRLSTFPKNTATFTGRLLIVSDSAHNICTESIYRFQCFLSNPNSRMTGAGHAVMSMCGGPLRPWTKPRRAFAGNFRPYEPSLLLTYEKETNSHAVAQNAKAA